jgi:hypothetical protein
MASMSASADPLQWRPEIRVATAYGGKYDADLLTLAWFTSAPGWTRAERIEFSAGVIQGRKRSRPIVFAGPVWRLTKPDRPSFIEFSTGPTLISGSTISGRELGGNLHFRSALAFGRVFGRRRLLRIALRFEHISNGGLRDENPGLESIGLSFVSAPGHHQPTPPESASSPPG